MTAAPPSSFWMLCLGGAAAGSSTKGLLESSDSGSSWRTVSQLTSLVRKPPARSIPSAEPSSLAAGSASRLWLSTTNSLSESADGGRSWNGVPSAFNSAGWHTTLSVLDADHAWLLAPGAGIWSTSDGQHWVRVGQFNPADS